MAEVGEVGPPTTNGAGRCAPLSRPDRGADPGDEVVQPLLMRTLPVDPTAIAALPEGVVVTAGGGVGPPGDVLLGPPRGEAPPAPAAAQRHQPTRPRAGAGAPHQPP